MAVIWFTCVRCGEERQLNLTVTTTASGRHYRYECGKCGYSGPDAVEHSEDPRPWWDKPEWPRREREPFTNWPNGQGTYD